MNSDKNMEQLLIFSSKDNVTYDYYIAPRLQPAQQENLTLIDPWTMHPTPILTPGQSIKIIINRYISLKLALWLRKNKKAISSITWVVDDDYPAMLSDKSVPFLKKDRPLITLVLYPFIRKQITCLAVSNPQIAKHYPSLKSVSWPPVHDISRFRPKPFNSKMIYYFAKMHAAEHKFLYPIIAKVLEKQPDLHFTVIANGHLATMWQQLPSVTILEEMHYPDYCNFIDNLPEGGLFLVPLLPSRLNENRSFAKLLEVARTSSAPILAQHDEFTSCLGTQGATNLPPNPQIWIDTILHASQNSQDQEQAAKNLRTKLIEIYENREMIL